MIDARDVAALVEGARLESDGEALKSRELIRMLLAVSQEPFPAASSPPATSPAPGWYSRPMAAACCWCTIAA